jgi:hypothetical protein
MSVVPPPMSTTIFAVRFGDRQSGADRGRHCFLDQINFRRLGAVRRIFDGAALDLRDLRRNADDDARPHPGLAVVRFADKMLEHFFRDLEIGDDAVLHRADRDDIARRPAEHFFGVAPDRFDLVGHFVDGDDRRLAHDNAASLRINERICRAEINCQIARE